jgi:hypothetical protein
MKESSGEEAAEWGLGVMVAIVEALDLEAYFLTLTF